MSEIVTLLASACVALSMCAILRGCIFDSLSMYLFFGRLFVVQNDTYPFQPVDEPPRSVSLYLTLSLFLSISLSLHSSTLSLSFSLISMSLSTSLSLLSLSLLSGYLSSQPKRERERERERGRERERKRERECMLARFKYLNQIPFTKKNNIIQKGQLNIV